MNPNTLYGSKFLINDLHFEKSTKKTESEREKKQFRRKTKESYNIAPSNITKNIIQVKGLDLVVEGFKDKLYRKKK